MATHDDTDDSNPLYSAATVARQWAMLQRERPARRAAAVTSAGLAALLATDLDLAQTALAALDAPSGVPQALDAAARAATSGAAATLAQRFDAGQLTVQWPATDAAQLALVAEPAPLPPGRWVQALAAAWIARDAQALGVLADAANLAALLDAAARPPADPDAFRVTAHYHQPWCELLAALARASMHGEPVNLNLGLLNEAVRLDLDSDGGPNADWLQAEVLGLAPLVAALGAGDRARVAAAVAIAQRGVDAHARAVAERLAPLPSLLLTGLQCLAHDRGLWQPAEPLWARAMITAAGAPATGTVSVRLAPRAARSAGEIHWYFDLLGAPRAGRRHCLDGLAEHLVATYQLAAWPGVPGAEAAFELRDDAQLLTPTQLLAVADLHAAAVDLRPDAGVPALRAQRAHLAEAAAALDLAQARLGVGAPATGRLVPSSLAAVRDEYRLLLAQIDVRLAQAAKPPPQDA